MLTDDLFSKVLLAPAIEANANRLRIISGYATASLADRHIEELMKCDANVNIELIVGMTRNEGIELTQHRGFRKIANNAPYAGINFSCGYVVGGNPVHAKTYCWLNDDTPLMGFVGSANYTLTGFGKSQHEAMVSADSDLSNGYFLDVVKNSVNCMADGIEELITFNETHRRRVLPNVEETALAQVALKSVTLSLLARGGNVPPRSGINWGQRPEYNRDPDQAYIGIPVQEQNSGFFPDRGERFTVMTDDGESFIMVRRQANGKALHTTQDNALIGRYLRARMGVASGEVVTMQHFDNYGRSDVTLSKINDETYYLDFSKPPV